MDVAVSPPVIVLKSKGPPCMTLHANIPMREVDLETVQLIIRTRDGTETRLEPRRLFADDCGDLVGKFDGEAIRTAVAGYRSALFILEASRLDGTLFSGGFLVTVK